VKAHQTRTISSLQSSLGYLMVSAGLMFIDSSRQFKTIFDDFKRLSKYFGAYDIPSGMQHLESNELVVIPDHRQGLFASNFSWHVEHKCTSTWTFERSFDFQARLPAPIWIHIFTSTENCGCIDKQSNEKLANAAGHRRHSAPGHACKRLRLRYWGFW